MYLDERGDAGVARVEHFLHRRLFRVSPRVPYPNIQTLIPHHAASQHASSQNPRAATASSSWSNTLGS